MQHFVKLQKSPVYCLMSGIHGQKGLSYHVRISAPPPRLGQSVDYNRVLNKQYVTTDNLIFTAMVAFQDSRLGKTG